MKMCLYLYFMNMELDQEVNVLKVRDLTRKSIQYLQLQNSVRV